MLKNNLKRPRLSIPLKITNSTENTVSAKHNSKGKKSYNRFLSTEKKNSSNKVIETIPELDITEKKNHVKYLRKEILNIMNENKKLKKLLKNREEDQGQQLINSIEKFKAKLQNKLLI